MVARDLRDGQVSIAAAARDYGVVAADDPPVIDVAGAAAGGTKPLPAVAWESRIMAVE